MTPVLALIALQCTLCWTIKVPVVWNDKSEVQTNQFNDKQNESPVQSLTPRSVDTPIPKEYFEYTAKKPQFATDIAAFHGVNSPGEHYRAYPVKPYTGVKKPELGKHHILESEKHAFEPYQKFVKSNEHLSYVTPASSSYNIFHPYGAEEPALKVIYQDPVLEKIRNDLKDSQYRLQKYEKDAGEPNFEKEEYLESPEQTDRKKFPHRHPPAPFEIHRPQRRPMYYLPPVRYNRRDYVLNKKIRHPWNQNYAKVTPFHYRPIKNHLQRLRQEHALKYDDENNEYPQIPPPLEYEERPDGYDIYEKGKDKFTQLSHNIDESINNSVKKNNPITNQNLELQNTNIQDDNPTDDYEFLPVKNYAQVRKIETVKHLPRAAAFQDAETFDDFRNAPRLREAIKSTKAQTVYSEEGYEDSAYDHAGQLKHASDHEGHGGYLKEKESSKGKYKIPSFSGSYKDERGSSYRDKVQHGEKWKNTDKENDKQNQEEDYAEDDQDYLNESEANENSPKDETPNDNEKENYYGSKNQLKIGGTPDVDLQHDLSKREAKFKIPEINSNSTLLIKTDIENISLGKLPLQLVNIKNKYPYYNKSEINKDSPLRYAENLKNIPKKSKGGTEFYDSRSQFDCPEVENNVDPVPEKLKKGGNPDDVDNHNANQDDDNTDDKPRLQGLGDKIDCFKIKYFGENPLDSPFFGEDIIFNPEPVTPPLSQIYKIFEQPDSLILQSQVHSMILKPITNNTKEVVEINKNGSGLSPPKNMLLDILRPKNYAALPTNNNTELEISENSKFNDDILTETKAKKAMIRKTRAAPFIYEPYKIIRDSQIHDSKKTTTTSNISPLIKQLQSSRVVDRVSTNMSKDQPVKRNTGSLAYKSIGRKERERALEKLENESSNSTVVDMNQDTRKIEPRFEQRPNNHKSQYTPVENKNSMSLETYRNRTKIENGNKNNSAKLSIRPHGKSRSQIQRRPFFDVSKYLPQTLETQKPEPSNKIQNIRELDENESKTIKDQLPITPVSQKSEESEESDEDYDEYEEEEEEDLKTTTSTTTIQPQVRKRFRIMTTTLKPENSDNMDKLRLVTRFRNPTTVDQNLTKRKKQEDILPSEHKSKKNDEHPSVDIAIPKYREKKKKSSKSTLVTDSTSYGEDDDDDMRKEEVDELIGIQHDMGEYIPLYEKEAEKEHQLMKNNSSRSGGKTRYETPRYDKKESGHEDDDDEIDDDVDSEEHKDISNENDNDNHDIKRHDDDDDDDDNDDEDDDDDDDDDDDGDNNDDNHDENEDGNDGIDEKHTITTPEPPRRTLIKTTEPPEVTTKARVLRPNVKPIISKKTIEIHKELPQKTSSPNKTQFTQDIKEVEIIKEIPSAKTMLHNEASEKDAEVLQLYKDENLAQEVNKLFDVEVFKNDLDLKKSPRHGGNYKSIKAHKNKRPHVYKKDSLSSQTQSKKLTELSSHGTSDEKMRIKNTNQRSRKNRGQNVNPERHNNSERKAMEAQKSAKLIELSEDENDKDVESGTENMHGGNFKIYSNSRSNESPMHGGNYRSARITQSDKHDNQISKDKMVERNQDSTKDIRRNSAALLDSFAKAVPILTTTPAYILDPSKRLYYYVD